MSKKFPENDNVVDTKWLEVSDKIEWFLKEQTEYRTSLELKNVKKDVNIEKDKAEIKKLTEENNLKKLKSLDDVESATNRYWEIMDTYGVDTVLWWLPGWDVASWVFSTFFLLYQAGKLPEWNKMSFIDKLKIFGLQVVDSFGKPVWKIWWSVYLAAQWAMLWLVLWPIGAVVGWVVWWVGWYLFWWVLFDYFFKANKWSSNIFKQHCDKVKKEALSQGMPWDEVSKLDKDQSKVHKFFDGLKKENLK